MSDDDFDILAERFFTCQARLDVLEKSFALFAAKTNRSMAEFLEDWLRHYNENEVSSEDPEEAARLRDADAAAVRLSDVIAATIGQLRKRG